MASAVSFQGLSTGLQTDGIVDAIITQASQPLVRLQTKQDNNTKRETLLKSLSTQLTDLKAAITNLNTSSFQGRTITNSDSTNQYVSASASGALNGTYEVSVQQLATKAQYVSANGLATTSTDLGGTAISGGEHDGMYKYSITDSNGKTQDIYLASAKNNLAGLRDAINGNTYSSTNTTGLAVTASIIQTSAAGGNNKLVLTAVNSGQGTAGSTFTVTGNGTDGLGIGALGQTSSSAKNALLTVNGISLERTSNTVSDVVDGVTFTLNSDAAPTKSSTLTIAPDKSGITTALQTLVTKFNTLYKTYKDNSGQGMPSTDASGNTVAGTPGALAGDSSLRSIIARVRSSLMSIPTGVSTDSTYKSVAELGLSTQTDGTLSLDTSKFQTALGNDITSVAQVFQKAGNTVQDYVNVVTSPGSGNIAQITSSIDFQNLNLARQITTMTAALAKKRTALQDEYARLEATVGQMQSASSSLTKLS